MIFVFSVLAALFLWWPPEVYEGWRYLGYALLFSVLLWSVCRRRTDGLPVSSGRSWPVIFLAIFFFFLVLSAIVGVDSYRSAEAVAGYAAVACLGVGIAMLGGAHSAHLSEKLEPVLICLTACLCLYGFYQYLFSLPALLIQPGAWAGLGERELFPALSRMAQGRVFSRFALPSSFACVLLATLPIVHRRLLDAPRPWPYALVLSAVSACLILTRSYGAVILFFGYGCVDAWIRHPRLRRPLAMASAVLLAVVIFFLRPGSLTDWTSSDNPVRLRLANWSVAYSEFLSAPAFGVGPGNYGLLFSAYSPGLTQTHFAHGFHMTVLSETGVFGFLAWMVLVASVSIWLWKHRPRYAPSLVLLSLYSLIDIVFELASIAFLFALLAGLSSPAPLRVRIWPKAASGVLAAIGIVFSLVLFQAHGYHEEGLRLMQSRKTRADISDAAVQFDMACRFWPNPAFDASAGFSHFLLAQMDKNESYLAAAVRDYQRAVHKSPAALRSRAGLGEALLLAGRGTEAMTHFKEAARLNPRGPYASRYLKLMLESSNAQAQEVAGVRSTF